MYWEWTTQLASEMAKTIKGIRRGQSTFKFNTHYQASQLPISPLWSEFSAHCQSQPALLSDLSVDWSASRLPLDQQWLPLVCLDWAFSIFTVTSLSISQQLLMSFHQRMQMVEILDDPDDDSWTLLFNVFVPSRINIDISIATKLDQHNLIIRCVMNSW